MPGIYPWTPNQVAAGYDTHPAPQIFGGVVQLQKGTYSFLPSITAPGTVASAGTVLNSTGADCLVYLTPTRSEERRGGKKSR